MPVSRETTAWAARMLLGKEPTPEMIDELRDGHETMEGLRAALLSRQDVRTAIAGATPFASPAFLLRPPASPAVPWRFEPPSLARPVSQLCTVAQLREPDYLALAPSLGSSGELHRKLWEFGFVHAVLRHRNLLRPGSRGVGFGTGQEPLPAIFAAAGTEVLATDMPADQFQAADWMSSAQWAGDVEQLWRPGVIGREEFLARVSFRPADMNAIDPALRGFDFNWSCSCIDHLGSVRKGMDFFHNCLETLRPGGTAVHTTEFNLDSDETTFESPTLSFFRKRDIESLFAELIEAGHAVEPLNTWPGTDPEDEHVDVAPYGMPHLKLMVGQNRITSIGVIVTKKS